MKISFSTLGCPEWSWEDMVATAKDLGFDGIEVRGVGNELHVPNARPFMNQNLNETRARLSGLKLEIPCLTSSCLLYDKTDSSRYIREAMEYTDLAGRLGVPFVRVLGDGAPEPGVPVDLDFVAANLKALAAHVKGKGVKVLVETNGQFADSGQMLRLLDKVGDPDVAVLWDVHHPFRYMDETIEKTYGALKDHIAFVHLKDSVIQNGRVKYKMMGYGDVPVRKAVQLLKDDGYQGFVSLEWVKRWCMDLEEPGVVFSHFINYMQSLS